MDINQLLSGSGPVTFGDITHCMALSERMEQLQELAKVQAAQEKAAFLAKLQDPNQPIGFRCDWCGGDQLKDPKGMDNMSEKELSDAMAHKVGLAAECISADNGETWFCSECESDCPGVRTIKLNEFHSYSYKDKDGTVLTIALKPKPKPKPYVKPYEHKYVAMDDAEFMPIGSEIVSHRGGDDIQYLVRMGPAKPKQPNPENCEFGEDELRYEALEWVDEMLDEYKSKHALDDEDSDDEDFWETLEEVAATANAALRQDSEKEVLACPAPKAKGKKVSFKALEEVHEIPNGQDDREARRGTWVQDGMRARQEEARATAKLIASSN